MEPTGDIAQGARQRLGGCGRRLACAFALTLAVLLPFVAWLQDGTLLGARDTARLYAPLRPLVVDALRNGSLPLWNPHEGTGHPLLAEGLHGVLHPLSLLAALLAPTSMNALLLAYLVAAALGAWVLARELGRSEVAAALCAITYGLSGFVTSMTDNLVFLAGAATLPWLVAGLRACARPGALPLLGAAAGVCCALLSGDVQSALVGTALGAILAFEAGGRRALRRAGLGLSLGVLLAAVQWLPTLMNLQQTDRKLALGEAARRQWALHPLRLLELATPGLFGTRAGSMDAALMRALGDSAPFALPFANAVHVGLPVLLLASRGALADRGARWLAVTTLVLLWLALGQHAGAAQLLGDLPLWGSFRYAEKLTGALSLVLALLAARGLDRELEATVPSWLPAAAAVATGLLGALLWFGEPLLALPADALAVAFGNLRSGFGWVAAATLAMAVLLALPQNGRGIRAWLLVIAMWSCCVAALPWSIHPMPQGCVGPDWLAHLEAPLPGVRIATPTPHDASPSQPDAWRRTWCELPELGVPAFGAAVGVGQIDLYTGLDPIRFLKVYFAFGEQRWRALRRFGVTHVVAAVPVQAGDAETLAAATQGGRVVATSPDGGLQAWSVPHRPWASFASAASFAPTPQQTLVRLQALVARGSDEVVVQADAAPAVGSGRILALRRGAEQVEIEAEASSPALLVVNDAWSPGWTARVDGSPAPVLPADVLVRAVPFPAGRHRLAMTYDPPEVRAGLALSGLGLVLLLVVAWMARRGSAYWK